MNYGFPFKPGGSFSVYTPVNSRDMKKQLILLASFLITLSSAFTQDKPCPHPGGMKGMRGKGRGIMQEMNLSEAQKTKMQEIRKDYRSKMAQLEKNDKITLKDYRSGQAALRQDMKKNMESLLTADQQNKMSGIKNKRQQEAEARMQRGLDRMKGNLSLSDDQYNRIKSGREKMKGRMTGIRENSSMSVEQKKQEIMALKQAGMQEMRAMLTDDQLKKMDDMKAGMRQHERGRGIRRGPASK